MCLPSSVSLHLRIGPPRPYKEACKFNLFRLRIITIIAMKIMEIPYIGETTITVPLLLLKLSKKVPLIYCREILLKLNLFHAER